ncbi:MAG: outer membrane protein assembly factor BamA, partial [Alphaproteobacteria bacterium]|nr:outer membrane protein assembly factor BamA [Alphaproteobacteria bacterium]
MVKRMHSGFRFWFCSLFILASCLPAAAIAQVLIRDVRVEGAERIEQATVKSYLNIGVGDAMTQENLNAALKSLFATGLFADVTLRQEGSTLVAQVVENPIINEIAFEGNDKVKDEELLAEIQLRPRQVFTRTRVQSDLRRIYQIYRRNGRFSANVEPQLIKLDQNRVNLVFEIDEGDVTKVESIRFVGNKAFDDSRLRSEISTKETAWYRFITSDDRYDQDRIAFDQELLRRFYLAHGYADYRLISAVAELSEEKDDFYITFTIEEGPRYKVGQINLDSRLRNFDASVLRPEISVETGDWYNADRLQESVDHITDALGDRQYAFVDVQPDVQRNRSEKTVDLSFVINETPRVFVERIDVNGNVRTLDKVLRREMEVVEGDPFNKSKLQRSEQNIKDLDFFETVEMKTKPGSAPDKTVIDIDVQEKSTGELSIGGGFSTSDGPLADFSIRERNFLGKGQFLSFSTVLSGTRNQFDLSFTEPYFLDRDLSAGVDAFYVTRDLQDESSYDQKRAGGALRMGYPLSERWRQTLSYRAERNEITNVQDNASRYIVEQAGKRETSAVAQRLTYDSRDSVIFPREGMLYWL